MMGEDDVRDYAEHLILTHSEDIEWLTIHEMAEDYFGNDLSEGDAERVDTAIRTARISVRWD